MFLSIQDTFASPASSVNNVVLVIAVGNNIIPSLLTQ